MYRKFKSCNDEGERIVTTLFECIYDDTLFLM